VHFGEVPFEIKLAPSSEQFTKDTTATHHCQIILQALPSPVKFSKQSKATMTTSRALRIIIVDITRTVIPTRIAGKAWHEKPRSAARRSFQNEAC